MDEWIRLAAEQDHRNAQVRLGEIYEKGEGLSRNELESLAWRYVAQSNGRDVKETVASMESNYGKEFSLRALQRAKELQSGIEKNRTQMNEKKPLNLRPPT